MFAYWGLKLVQWFVCILPASCAHLLGRICGGLCYYIDARHRKIALKNLCLVFGEKWKKKKLRRMARKFFCQLGFNLVEFLRVPCFIRPGWENCFQIEGEDRIKAAFEKGKGIIFVLAHFGNWEYLSFTPRLLSFPGAVVGQEIKNPAVDGLIKDMRELMGLELFPKFEVVPSILSYLKRNGAVAILADQRARIMNVRVSFFGHPADTTTAPAVLSLRSGATLLPVFIYYEGNDRYRIVFEREVEVPSGLPLKEAVRELTQRITSLFEERIKERPELWLWGHRRWKKD